MQVNCPVCNSNDFLTQFKVKDHLVSNELFEIAKCKNCGMHITLNPPSDKDLPRYYEAEEYVSHSDTQKGIINWAYHRVRNLMLSKKARWIIQNVGINRGRLLDIGAGTGYFAHTMKSRTWDVSAVEQSDVARQYSIDKFGLTAFDSIDNCIEAEKNKNNKIDVITLWHVLEHLPDPNLAIQQFHSLLTHDGLLVVAVPNCDSYDAKKYQHNWAAYDVPRHLWHFQFKQLKSLIENNGFRLVNLKTMPFDAFYIAILSEKQRGSSNAVFKGIWTGTKAYVKSVFNKKQSSSLVYFFKK